MQLSACEKICDEDKFVESHTAIINSNCSERVKKPYKDRLLKYKKLKAGM